MTSRILQGILQSELIDFIEGEVEMWLGWLGYPYLITYLIASKPTLGNSVVICVGNGGRLIYILRSQSHHHLTATSPAFPLLNLSYRTFFHP